METTPAMPEKFEQLLQLPKIERHHLDVLTPIEKGDFLKMVHARIPSLQGEELDYYVAQTSALLDQHEIWEFNHRKIEAIIERHVQQTGGMPGTTEIAMATKLSRPTVRKHLTAMNTPAQASDQTNSIALMVPRVMGAVLKQALRGDLKAAKIYIEGASRQKETRGTVINQNNHIQINNILINQRLISQLPPDKLKRIEFIITGKDDEPE